MSRGTRVISRLQLPPEVLARFNPPLRAAGEYPSRPTSCSTPAATSSRRRTSRCWCSKCSTRSASPTRSWAARRPAAASSSSSRATPRPPAGSATTRSSGWPRPGASRVIVVVPELPDPDRRGGAARLRKIVRRRCRSICNPIAEFFAERLDELRPLFVQPGREARRAAGAPGAARRHGRGQAGAARHPRPRGRRARRAGASAPRRATSRCCREFKAKLREREFAAAADGRGRLPSPRSSTAVTASWSSSSRRSSSSWSISWS